MTTDSMVFTASTYSCPHPQLTKPQADTIPNALLVQAITKEFYANIKSYYQETAGLTEWSGLILPDAI